MKRFDLIVVGAGPSGLCAAIEAAKYGLDVAVFDENARPGGQLFKQIHKFFGSKEHGAKLRGINIGEDLLRQAAEAGVDVELNCVVMGIFPDKEVLVHKEDRTEHYKADTIIVATGASENAVTFDGWTLPGVIGAGAAQMFMNLNGVRPGQKVLMVGTGNVGLVVSFQLLQAGCEVVALVDAAPRVGGYGVHASKLTRTGVPFYTSHTIMRAEGEDRVTGVVIAEVDSNFQFIEGTEKHFDVDTICLAVGLSPQSQLLSMAGCEMVEQGGRIPVIDERCATTEPGVFAAGDCSGIEEASSAMIEGRIAAVSAAQYLGYLTEEQADVAFRGHLNALDRLRLGMFAPQNRGKVFTETDEGIALSQSLLKNGFVTDEEVDSFGGITHTQGWHAVIECTQNIPCNPCQDVCPRSCINVGANITTLPTINSEAECSNCGKCVAFCPGQAIFLVNEDMGDGTAQITIPYEFLPLPEAGTKGVALDRAGVAVCEAEVIAVKNPRSFDHTALLTMSVPTEYIHQTRFFKTAEDAGVKLGVTAGAACAAKPA